MKSNKHSPCPLSTYVHILETQQVNQDLALWKSVLTSLLLVKVTAWLPEKWPAKANNTVQLTSYFQTVKDLVTVKGLWGLACWILGENKNGSGLGNEFEINQHRVTRLYSKHRGWSFMETAGINFLSSLSLKISLFKKHRELLLN